MAFEKIEAILAKYGHRHCDLIGILQDVQREENHLSEETLRYISKRLDIPLSRIFHIATFYKSFSLKRRGRHIIRVCRGTACHLNGAVQTVGQIERLLRIHEGETTEDGEFSLETVYCLGTCALAPVTMVDEDYHGTVTPGGVEEVLSKYNRK